jgi:hypothetical protein
MRIKLSRQNLPGPSSIKKKKAFTTVAFNKMPAYNDVTRKKLSQVLVTPFLKIKCRAGQRLTPESAANQNRKWGK